MHLAHAAIARADGHAEVVEIVLDDGARLGPSPAKGADRDLDPPVKGTHGAILRSRGAARQVRFLARRCGFAYEVAA
jgi:hypothetical protein